MPAALHPGALTKLSGKDARILYVEDLAGLIAGVQMNTLEFHVWGSRRQKPHLPERIVFDIDPDEGLGFEHVKQAALDIRDVLGALELTVVPAALGRQGRPCRRAADAQSGLGPREGVLPDLRRDAGAAPSPIASWPT